MFREPAPIAMFVHVRLEHARSTLEALRRNDLADRTVLHVFSDGPRNHEEEESVGEVRQWLATIDGFSAVHIHESERNKGLARSIIEGVSEVLSYHDRVIVIEDDIVSAPGTLTYFNLALGRYRDEPAVFSISAYSPPASVIRIPEDYEFDAYFVPRMMCWGWATWRDRWEKADWDMYDYDTFVSSPSQKRSYEFFIGRDSMMTLNACVREGKDVWACRWVYTHFKHHALCLCPTRSYVDNIGLDGTGANCGKDGGRLRNDLSGEYPETPRLPDRVYVDPVLHAGFMSVYDGRRGEAASSVVGRFGNSLERRVREKMKRWLVSVGDRMLAMFEYRHAGALERLGTDYGGWRLPEGQVRKGDTVISAGAGEDISFDVELAKRINCTIHVLDPTPRAIRYFEATRDAIRDGRPAPINNSDVEFYDADPEVIERLVYHPVGLWGETRMMRFYEPANRQHVSHSIDNLHGTDGYFEAEVVTIGEFARRNGLDEKRISLLKMDIEGAEYPVIREMLGSSVRPRVLMVEFHPGKSTVEWTLKPKTLLHVLLLRLHGYRLVSRVGWDFVFVRAG